MRMSIKEQLLLTEKPWFHMLIASESDAWGLAIGLQSESVSTCVKVVRGFKSLHTEALFDEFSAALQFPYYFGENWNAFAECITDFDWLPQSNAYIILILNALDLLSEEEKEELEVFIRLVQRAGQEWNISHEEDDFPRSAKAFHVLLQCSEDEVSAVYERFTEAGAIMDLDETFYVQQNKES